MLCCNTQELRSNDTSPNIILPHTPLVRGQNSKLSRPSNHKETLTLQHALTHWGFAIPVRLALEAYPRREYMETDLTHVSAKCCVTGNISVEFLQSGVQGPLLEVPTLLGSAERGAPCRSCFSVQMGQQPYNCNPACTPVKTVSDSATCPVCATAPSMA